jgi:hypothetical protein
MSERSYIYGALGLGLVTSLSFMSAGGEVSAAQAPGYATGSPAEEQAHCVGQPGEIVPVPGIEPAPNSVASIAGELVNLSTSVLATGGNEKYASRHIFKHGSVFSIVNYRDFGSTCVNGHLTQVKLPHPELVDVEIEVNEPGNSKVLGEYLSFLPPPASNGSPNSDNTAIWSASAQYITKKSSNGFGDTRKGTVVGREVAEVNNGQTVMEDVAVEVTHEGVVPIVGKTENKPKSKLVRKILGLVEEQAAEVTTDLKNGKLANNTEIVLHR